MKNILTNEPLMIYITGFGMTIANILLLLVVVVKNAILKDKDHLMIPLADGIKRISNVTNWKTIN